MNRTDRLYALVEELRAVVPGHRSARELADRFETVEAEHPNVVAAAATTGERAPVRDAEVWIETLPWLVARPGPLA